MHNTNVGKAGRCSIRPEAYSLMREYKSMFPLRSRPDGMLTTPWRRGCRLSDRLPYRTISWLLFTDCPRADL